ncbi:MAG TPA: hypothetical protein DDW52_26470 [Planctomycetaceae bacterium]|nr:hypothetical protein [Planctomycetaceae bacterium]
MAIEESKRENLLRDATAYVRRIAFRDARPVSGETLPPSDAVVEPGQVSEVFYGERSGRDWSLYLDEDPVLQFDSSDKLRRLYFRNTRYRAENGRLVVLSREQRGGRVRLIASEIEDSAIDVIKTSLQGTLARLAADLDAGRFTVVGSVPVEASEELGLRCREAIQRVGMQIEIAAQPSSR